MYRIEFFTSSRYTFMCNIIHNRFTVLYFAMLSISSFSFIHVLYSMYYMYFNAIHSFYHVM
nr:MAG TPA: hypothetical protein [Caudoviricetes sp.]